MVHIDSPCSAEAQKTERTNLVLLDGPVKIRGLEVAQARDRGAVGDLEKHTARLQGPTQTEIAHSQRYCIYCVPARAGKVRSGVSN